MLLRSVPILGAYLVVLALFTTYCNAHGNHTIKVNLTDTLNETSQRSVTVPRVMNLLITVPQSWNFSEKCTVMSGSCDYSISGNDTLSFSREGFANFTLYITVDESLEIACRNYIFNTSSEQLTLSFNCTPAFKTGTTMLVNRIQWRRFNNTNDLDMSLRNDFVLTNIDNDDNVLTNISGNPDMNVTISGEQDVSLEIQSRTNESAVGFYLPSFMVPGREGIPAQSFVIYLPPRIITVNESSTIATLGSSAEFECMVCSFPQATVKWERNDGELTHMVYENVSGDDPDCSHRFTVTGKIEFDNVRYSDAGVYTCRAENKYSMSGPPDLDFRLRVHSPLRPLWPAIGMIGVFLITPLFILGGHIFDKWWAKRNPTHNNESDGLLSTTVGFGKRPFSVSDADNPNDVTVRKDHKPIRRISSAKQELLTESSSPD